MANRDMDSLAREDFNKARGRALFSQVLALLRNQKDDLLSLQEVKALVRPKSEFYRGMRTVPIALIAGSEGRYQDFNRKFLPRRQHLRQRWERVDVAHHARITLPPIKLYEIGGIYFVRDGNHRVSVARTQGVAFIDAEIISLGSQLRLKPDMSRDELRAAVIELEKQGFYSTTRLDRLRPEAHIEFTATGRYDELIRHIHGHKYFINLYRKDEIPLREALLSWYDHVYEPVVAVVRKEKILTGFPGRTEADLYVWVVRHWDELKHRYGERYPLRDAATDFLQRFGDRPLARLINGLLRRLNGRARRG